MRDRIERLLETIRPAVRKDGGDIELVDAGASDGIVRLRFHGACTHCALAPLTLKLGIAMLLKKELPEIKDVVSVN